MTELDLLDIACDLKKRHRCRADILESCVRDRLDKSLSIYYEQISDSCEYLGSRVDEMTVMKKINKEL